MDALVLYFTHQPDDKWSFRALPISRTHLDSIPASSPKPIHRGPYSSNWDRLSELIDELSRLCRKNGALQGWKIHLLEEPVVINGQSHAKVIVTSTVPGIKLGPSTVVSSPTDATREDSAAVREVPTILDSGSSG